MPKINFKYTWLKAPEDKYGAGYSLNSITKKDFEKFNPSLLGLGDISQEGRYAQALVAFFDLEGFTEFCNQVDSHLVIPEFLTQYINWVFASLAIRAKEGEQGDSVTLWGVLPFYVKFLGDGLLFMWDTQSCGGSTGIRSIVSHLHSLTGAYQSSFLPEVKKHVSNPPTKLRCGIARGQVISVGDNEDYVGSCINIASRLQKLSLLSFAVSRRGLDLLKKPCPANLSGFQLVKTSLRGIGEGELVYVLKKELESLPKKERSFFQDP